MRYSHIRHGSYIRWLLILLAATTVRAHDSHLFFESALHGIADNREYSNSLTIPQTFFGMRAEILGGAAIDSRHALRIGASYFQQFGDPDSLEKLRLVLFYEHRGTRTRFLMGSFPRDRIAPYPRALLSDSLHYFRPLMQGGWFEAFAGPWRTHVWIDWLSRQREAVEERFVYGLGGDLRLLLLHLRHRALMYHHAHAQIRHEGDKVREYGATVFEAGIVLQGFFVLDSLSAHAGPLISFSRDRNHSSHWSSPWGIQTSLQASRGGLFLHGLVYAGHSHNVPGADGFYRARRYGRVDLGYGRQWGTYFASSFSLGLHLIEGKVDFSQQFLLSCALGQRTQP